MDAKQSDREIVASLEKKIGRSLQNECKYDDNEKLISLELDGLDLSFVPSELGQLANLQRLDLDNNQLSHIPPELGQLTNLHVLSLSNNLLTQVPPELGQLTNLHVLSLNDNLLTQVPPELGQLTSLLTLSLDSNRLSHIPPELGQLTSLQSLILGVNQLTQVPSEFGQLVNLEIFHLYGNLLSQVPPQLSQLINLKVLALESNQFTQVPSEVGLLTNLQELDLSDNQLTQIPPQLSQLTNLQNLYLDSNQLSRVPPQLSQLTNLQNLWLHNNQLSQIPLELGQLTNLQTLNLYNNDSLLTPPPEIAERGTSAILAFLRELQNDSVVRYEAKLLVVGEGGTGKSSLLKSLRNEGFDTSLSTTHGIEVDQLRLPHPRLAQQEITLNTWDFGGQHIYHATHQFFLTKRSVYLVVWNARLGVEQGRLNFWLDTIKALAPDAPVLLVATHTDERTPDINYQLYQDAYPQLVGRFSVSNKNSVGLDDLRIGLAQQAVGLGLMGQPWPTKWVEVEKALRVRREHHISADRYRRICAVRKIEAKVAQGTLGGYLHDLGKILYFRDDYILSNMVVLKPNWVTKAISRVLEDTQTSEARGILAHADLPRIWAMDEDGQDYEPSLYPVFLRLMERFDLSYQITPETVNSASTRSLIPQLLPHQPPDNVPDWPQFPSSGQTYVEMRYRFDFLPAGIMPWFIVRTHRYTQNLHWREGVVLQYQGHQARVELNPIRRELRLVVWGVQPHNFFTILMNTVDLILERFEGLHVERRVPCICHWKHGIDTPCTYFYPYEYLVRRMDAQRHEVECQESFLPVPVPELLYGIHTSTNELVIVDIQRGQQQLLQHQQQVLQGLALLPEMALLLQEMNQRTELMWRGYMRQWNFEMQNMEAECPNTFLLLLHTGNAFNPKNWVSQDYQLHLVCQHPPSPHPVGEGYSLREAKDWWLKMSPWLNHLITVLKVAVPMGKAIGGVYDATGFDAIKTQVALMEEITKNIPALAKLDTLDSTVPESHLSRQQQVAGPALRTLYSFLHKADESHAWGGLQKIVTPDGNILWLCGQHRQQYEVKPLDARYIRS